MRHHAAEEQKLSTLGIANGSRRESQTKPEHANQGYKPKTRFVFTMVALVERVRK